MPYLTIESFRFGLDARKSQLTEQPGTLLVLENAHINTGGEIEKRKALVRQANNFNNCFGLEVVDIGPVTFGSIAEPIGVYPTPPPPCIFVQVRHPALIQNFAGTAYDAAYHKVIAVPFSVNFYGKPFVAVTFSDGNTFFYYDYTYDGHYHMNGIAESYMGLVLVKATGPTLMTSADIAQQIRTLIGSYFASFTTSSPSADVVDIKSPSGVTFVETITAVGGTMTAATIGVGFAGTGTSAYAAFKITATGAATTWTLTAPIDYNGNVVTVPLVTGLATGTTDILTTANAIAATINAGSSVHQYSAVRAGADTIYIYFPIILGTTGNGKVITITNSGGGTIATTGLATQTLSIPGFVVNGSTNPGGYTLQTTVHGATQIGQIHSPVSSAQVGLAVSGGTPPYTYQWFLLSTSGTNSAQMAISSTTSVPVTFTSGKLVVYYAQVAVYQCVVTDNNNTSITSGNLTVKFLYTN